MSPEDRDLVAEQMAADLRPYAISLCTDVEPEEYCDCCGHHDYACVCSDAELEAYWKGHL